MAVEFLEFARGPLFVATFMFMVLGLLRLVFLQTLEMWGSWTRTADHDVPWKKNVTEFIKWIIPSRNTVKTRPFLSAVSFIFHIGLILVPIFLASHLVLWESGVGGTVPAWLSMTIPVADVLTATTIVTGLILLAMRIFYRPLRVMSASSDYLLLIVLLVPFVSGFVALHPSMLFTSYTTMMIIHVLSAELVFVLMPFSKLGHAVLFPFDRLSSDFYWKLSTDGPEKLARAMRGEDLKV